MERLMKVEVGDTKHHAVTYSWDEMIDRILIPAVSRLILLQANFSQSLVARKTKTVLAWNCWTHCSYIISKVVMHTTHTLTRASTSLPPSHDRETHRSNEIGCFYPVIGMKQRFLKQKSIDFGVFLGFYFNQNKTYCEQRRWISYPTRICHL